MAAKDDSIDSLVAEAQKYIIGVSSTQEDFVRPRYKSESTQASMPKAIMARVASNIQSEQDKAIEPPKLSAKAEEPAVSDEYDIPSKASAIREPTESDLGNIAEAQEQLQSVADEESTPAYKIPSDEEIDASKNDDFEDGFEDSLEAGLNEIKNLEEGIINLDAVDKDKNKKEPKLPSKSKLQKLHVVVKNGARPEDANNTDVGHYDSALGAIDTAFKLANSEALSKTANQLVQSMNESERSNVDGNSYVIEGGIKPKPLNSSLSEKETMAADETEAAEKEDPRITQIVDNSPVVNMLNVGADAMQNAFDAFFYYPAIKGGEDTQVGSYDQSGSFQADAALQELDPSSPLLKLVAKMAGQTDGDNGIMRYFKNIMMPSVVGTRIQSITIPQMTISTSAVDFLGKSISKQDMPELNQKGQFSIRTDQNLYLIDAFNYMAGQNILVTGFLDNEKSLHDRIKATSQIPKVWSRMKAFTGGYRLSDPGLCLIIKLRNLGQKNINNYKDKFKDYVDYDEMKKQFVPDDMMPYYVFENIKILGTDDAINFSSGSASMGQAMNISFIFRRLIRVLIFDESDTERPIMSLNTLRNSSDIWWY